MAEYIAIFGVPLGIAVFILFQVFKDPNKIDKYAAIFYKPLFNLFRWCTKKYIGAEVSFQVTEYFNRYFIRNIANRSDVKISVNWVLTENDPILKEDNTVIVCLRRDKDQTKNILRTAEISLPIITFSNLRSNLRKHVTKSIDLVSLRSLAKKLGNHGKYTFKKYFLDPQIEIDERISLLFQKLVEVDNRGYFIPIFINELEYIGEGVFSEGDTNDYTNEIIEFIEYLIQIARIEVGDDVRQWSYFSKVFNAGIILLANNERMIRQGVRPYIDRITKNLKQGHESIYILAEENSWDFLQRYENAIRENDRILIKGSYYADGIVNNDPRRRSKVKIMLLRKIDVYVDDLFKEKIYSSNIEVGSIVTGEVLDVSEESSIVSIMGIDAYIKKNECSWYKINSCNEILKIGQKLDFLVKTIDESKLSVELSLKFDRTDPWNIMPKLKVGDNISVKVLRKNGIEFYSQDSFGHEISIPNFELSWFGTTENEKDSILNNIIDVTIYEIDEKNKHIKGSIRKLNKDPWPEINKRIQPGTEYIGRVIEVTPFFIRVEIGNGLNGIIPKERLTEAGGIFSNFTGNVIVGQGIEVVVTRVFVQKRKIHLKLKL